MEVRRRLPGAGLADKFSLAAEESKLRESLDLPPHFCVEGIAEWQRIFVSIEGFDDLWAHERLREDTEYLEVNGYDLASLWNMTPRPQLGGRRPAELFLRDLLLNPPTAEFSLRSSSGSVLCEHLLSLMNKSQFTPEFISFVEAGRRENARGTRKLRPEGSAHREKPPGTRS